MKTEAPVVRSYDFLPVSPHEKKRNHDIQDLICLSHLRWDFVFQRPQHLMSRFAQASRVFFVEEPVLEDIERPRLDITEKSPFLRVCVPVLPHALARDGWPKAQKELLETLMVDHEIGRHILWYYTPMALEFTQPELAALVVYDCMDELSNFKGASPALKLLEKQLFKKADLVFTGGHSLYEAKRNLHYNIHAVPSSVDMQHFAQARAGVAEPEDQKHIAGPKIGFVGVIDERMDLQLLRMIGHLGLHWNFVMIGPVVKINEHELPRLPNIHYLGAKKYGELPAYLSGWDVAILPFARNDATRFISPTKTPEYLAAGKPVVSTSIQDVVDPYEALGFVRIADTGPAFVQAIGEALSRVDKRDWQSRVDAYLANHSWDRTWMHMNQLVQRTNQLQIAV